MNFVDSHVNKAHRFSLGVEIVSGRCYLAIAVANRLAGYEEYYEISRSMHDAYPSNVGELVAFAQRCSKRQCDDLLFLQPGADRGIA